MKPTTCLALLAATSLPAIPVAAELIGHDLNSPDLSFPEGDSFASEFVFIHEFPFPADGFVTGGRYKNDSDQTPETIDVLILRPVADGWDVVHRIPLAPDDTPPTATGFTDFSFGASLPVEAGDIFAYWQPGGTGPIPLDIPPAAPDIFPSSTFEPGFTTDEVDTGDFIFGPPSLGRHATTSSTSSSSPSPRPSPCSSSAWPRSWPGDAADVSGHSASGSSKTSATHTAK